MLYWQSTPCYHCGQASFCSLSQVPQSRASFAFDTSNVFYTLLDPSFFLLETVFHFESFVISGLDQEFSQPLCHFKMNPNCVCNRLAPGCHNYCYFVCKQTIRSCKENSQIFFPRYIIKQKYKFENEV